MIYLFLIIGLNLDIAQFSYPGAETFCELYYSIPGELLEFKGKKGKFTANFSISLLISDETSGEIVGDTVKEVANTTTLSNLPDFKDIKQVVLSPKKRYKIRLNAYNLKEEIFYAETTIVTPEWDNKFLLSDIQISHTLINTDKVNRFTKNGFKLIPFPERIFSRERYLLTSYCELYNVNEDSILITYIISNTENFIDTVINEYYKNLREGNIMILPGIFNLLGYSPGSYALTLIASSKKHKTVSSKNFSIIKIQRPSLVSIPDSIMDYASFINYIASPKEIALMNSLSAKAKERFLVKFWMKRDPDLNTKENEALNEFVERVEYSDKYFATARRSGRFSDRGRIYIKYGAPDDIIRRTSDMLYSNPYIMWHYYDTDVWFIFINRDISEEYLLIYSGVAGELTDPGWRSLILLEDRERLLGVE